MSHLSLVITKKSVNAIELVASGIESEASLKKKYVQEYNSWRSRRLWAKQHNIPFHPDWNVFSVFLEYVGLAPTKDHTIDRIKNELGYVPSNIRWASKQLQAENRDNVIWLEYEGKRHTLTEWAGKTGQTKSTLFKRYKANWPTENVITGIKPRTVVPKMYVPRNAPWPESHRDFFEYIYRHHYPSKNVLRLSFLFKYVRETLKSIDREVGFLVESWFPTGPDMQFEIPSGVLERVEKLKSKKMLYLKFLDHAKQALSNHNRIMNGDLD